MADDSPPPDARITAPAAHAKLGAKRDMKAVIAAIMKEVKSLDLGKGITFMELFDQLERPDDKAKQGKKPYGAPNFVNLGIMDTNPVEENSIIYTYNDGSADIQLRPENFPASQRETIEHDILLLKRDFTTSTDLMNLLSNLDQVALHLLIYVHLIGATPSADNASLERDAEHDLTQALQAFSAKHTAVYQERSMTDDLGGGRPPITAHYHLYELLDEERAEVIRNLATKVPDIIAMIDASMKKHHVGKYALAEHAAAATPTPSSL